MLNVLILLLAVVLVAAGTVVLWAIGTYNALAAARDACRNAFAQIDASLRRRHDLIAAWVEAVAGHVEHERETLDAVTAAHTTAVAGLVAVRANVRDVQAMAQLGLAESQLGGTLGRLLGVADACPGLGGETNLSRFREDLTATAHAVSIAQQAFNESVQRYNRLREAFPGSLIAAGFDFAAMANLEISRSDDHQPATALLS